jgi:signal transduction histidine kinase
MMNYIGNGTSSFISGRSRSKWRNSSLQFRLLAFAAAVAAVAFLIIRIDSNIWRAQAHLEEGFAEIKAEKFYFGVSLRTNLRKLRDLLIDYDLTANPDDLKSFRERARELNSWLQNKKRSFVAPDEREAFAKLQAAYGDFLRHVEPLMQTNGLVPSGGDGFASAYAKIRQDYRPVLNACEEVVQAEHSGFDAFLQESDRTLVSLQRLFMASLLLLVALAATLALLVYRGMIAPLRAQLTESQALVVRQEKLASLGALGTGVAHEIRNPLTAIKFRLFSLKKSLPPVFAENEDVRTISEEIGRLDRIVKDFLQFARPSEPELVRVPAERILHDIKDLMKSELQQTGIELRLGIMQAAWIRADTQQLRQVLINLIQNSADSIGTNGVITLDLQTAARGFSGGNRLAAVLSVTDTGKGISGAVQKRLFDPFFTTKEGGSGLGLAIAARIVEKHGGVLRYRTELNRGTTFEIILPRTEEHATENSAN